MMWDLQNRPCIGIFSDEQKQEMAQEIAYGIEENGVPYRIIVQDSDCTGASTALEYAYGNACGVAITVHGRDICVYTDKIHEPKPLFTVRLKTAVDCWQRRDDLRCIGRNAVCILLKKSFKEIKDDI